MSSTSAATRPSSTFDVSNLAPVVAQPPAQPVVVVPEPAKPNPLAEGWKSFKESPHGRAIKTWTNGLAVIAPVALTAGAGYAIGGIDPHGASAVVGALLGGVAGLISLPFQLANRTGIIEACKRAGHDNPHWASFANVTGYMTTPAAVTGATVALSAGSGWGVAAAVVAGFVGSFLGITAQNYRLKDHPPVDY